MFIIYLIVIAVMILWCHSIAKRNGRNTALASIMGFFFGIFAVIVYYAIGETEEKKEMRIRKVLAKNQVENMMVSAMEEVIEKLGKDGVEKEDKVKTKK